MDSAFDLDFGTTTLATTWGRSLRGRERMNDLFRFDVMFVASLDDDDLSTLLLERPVTIRLHESARAIHGIVESIRMLDTYPQGARGYSMRVAPRLSGLKRRKNNRIFQEKSVLEIASTLLDEHGILHSILATATYPELPYCVQYQESDYAFLKRLLWDAGLFFYFDHPCLAADDPDSTMTGVSEVLIISDTAAIYAALAAVPTLAFRHEVGMHRRPDEVYGFTVRRRVRPRSTLVRAYDFRRPALDVSDTRLALARGEAIAENGGPLDRRAFSKDEADQFDSVEHVRRRIYVHENALEEASGDASPAIVQLERERADVIVGSGWTVCPDLQVGHRVALAEHFSETLNQDYAITVIEHELDATDLLSEGKAPYRNRIECVPGNVRARRRPTRRRLRQVLETAVVLAPAGKEIHADEQGRIRVRFHWDLAPENDEQRSCWIRVAQPWAGSNWGAQFIPRAGMEVLVSFLGGDLDKPVVIGALYNATHPLPFGIPDRVTQSGFRTRSTPDGDGFNELVFDDARGGEVVMLRAQRDFTENILNNHRIEVGADQAINVAGGRKTQVTGVDELRVMGGQTTTIQGPCLTTVQGKGSASIGGDRECRIAGNDTVRIAGAQTLVISDAQHTVIGGAPERSDATFTVNGDYRVGAAKQFLVRAAEGLKLVCGDSTIELLPAEIKLTTPKLTISASDGLSCKGSGNELSMNGHLELKADEIKLFSKNGSFVMDDEAKLDAKQVKLNCDPNRPKPDPAKDSAPEKGIITFKLDPQLHVAPGDRFTMLIAMPDGTVIEREADANHQVEIEGIKGDRYTLVDVRKDGKSLSKKGS